MELKQTTQPNLESLVDVFYADASRLGTFETVAPNRVCSPYSRLLEHNHHMTVAVEDFHNSSVDVRVLEVQQHRSTYSRKISLLTQDTGNAVQFGIVRLDLSVLEPQVQEQIKQQQIPLGRVLIENNVLRQVALHQLYRVKCGPDLAKILNVPVNSLTYGRTALIYCNGKAAVELLEIVSPVDPAQGST